MMDTQRLILLFIFGFSLIMLWDAWQKETRPKPAPSTPTAEQGVPTSKSAPSVTPQTGVPAAGNPAAPSAGVPGTLAPSAKGETVRVRTDLFIAEIDTLGGTLKHLELLKHKDASDPSKNFLLMGPDHRYEAESG